MFACTTCTLDTHEEVQKRQEDEHARLLMVTADSVMCMKEKAETLWERSSTRQGKVTHINSETKGTRTCSRGRWLNMSNCFIGYSLRHCSLARSVYLSHTHSLRQPASFSVCPIVTDKDACAILQRLARLPSPTSLLSLSSNVPSLFLPVFHLSCPVASPLPFNHTLLLSFRTLAHSQQHNGYWSDM